MMKVYCKDYIEKLRAMIQKLCKHYRVPDGDEFEAWDINCEATVHDLKEAEELLKQDDYLL